MRARLSIVAAIASASMACLLAPTAGAAVSTVKIEPTGFDPAVVVVAPGATVKWLNRDLRPRALRGDVDSPSLAPGGSFELRFRRPGVYEYGDRDNPLLTGTVIVAAGYARGKPHYPSPSGPRIVTHRWRVDLRIDLRESWKYMDGKYLTFDGPCNAQVGKGSRTVGLRASFPSVKYQRAGRIEILSGKSAPYRIQRYREMVDSKTSNPSGDRVVDCGDGSSEAPPEIEQKCNRDQAGTRVRAELFWSPKIAQGRFAWPHEYLGRAADGEHCGHSFLAGHLVGLDSDFLPWDPGAGAVLLYDHGRTGPATAAETRALRDGRAITVKRSFELQWTADCCLEWHEPDKPGTYVRVGARHEARGEVTLRFTPH